MAELALATISVAELCIVYGRKLVETYHSFKHANEVVHEKTLMIEALWSRTAIQVDFVMRIVPSLGDEHCKIQFEVFQMLQSKLTIAVTKIESIVRKTPEGGIKRWKFLFIRKALDETFKELEQWQRLFDPTWFSIFRVENNLIDQQLLSSSSTLKGSAQDTPSGINAPTSSIRLAKALRRAIHEDTSSEIHVTLSDKGLDWENASTILYSTTRLVDRVGSRRRFVVDSIICDSTIDLACAKADTESLARRLQNIDPSTSGLLSCHGVVKRRSVEAGQLTSLDLIFKMPPTGDTPQTLRQVLMQKQSISLTEVLSTACQLARAVSFVHSYDFVHKNIRPETIMLFQGGMNGERALGDAFLLGFDAFRSVNFRTSLAGDAEWERNLYRHPSRQGLQAQEKYTMRHDIYSLGVCLLEIGLWDSFVVYKQDDGAGIEGTRDRTLPGKALGLETELSIGSSGVTPLMSNTKDRLVDLARCRLPAKMGDKYSAIVVACLTSMDEGSTAFRPEDRWGEEADNDDDDAMVGVYFIRQVLFGLGEISL